MTQAVERERPDDPVLPEQTADDEVDQRDRSADDDDPDDLARFLRDVPPHHEA